MLLFVSAAGKQLVHVDKIELKSVVPNSQPETFINVRGTEIPIVVISLKKSQTGTNKPETVSV